MYLRFFHLLILLLLPSALFAAPDCDSPYKGQRFTQVQLNQALQQDKTKLNLCGTNLSGLNLSGRNLAGINFYGADLSKMNFNNTNLSDANLHKAYLRWSSLKKASLFRANLAYANLQQADLSAIDLRQANLSHANLSSAIAPLAQASGANFSHAILDAVNFNSAQLNWVNFTKARLETAQLQHAKLNETTLKRANLFQADLSHADFSDADLTQVNLMQATLANTGFSRANLNRTIYQPALGHLPNLILLATAKNFRHMQFNQKQGTPALTELRNAYKKIGMRPMERQITTMLKIKEMQQAWQKGGWGYLESTLSYVFFYLTSDYGADPGRPLRIFLILILVFALPYLYVLINFNRNTGIVVTWQSKQHFYHWNTHQKEPVMQQERITFLLKKRRAHGFKQQYHEWLRVIRIALFFSLLSSFQIGWRELNVGNWISRIQAREYTLKAKGWARMLAGSQALISAYLIVLWALSYFGRPFEW